MVTLSIIFKVIAVVLFLYLTWRRLSEDYDENKLVAFSWIGLLFFLIGGRLVYGLFNSGFGQEWWQWLVFWERSGEIMGGGYLGFLLLSGVWAWRNGWKLWSFLEDNVFGFLILCFFWMVGNGIGEGFSVERVKVVVMILVVFLSNWLLVGKYRSFVWYRSGRKGFIFFWANILGWLLLALFAIIGKNWGEMEYLYLGLGLIFGAGLFILGGVLKRR